MGNICDCQLNEMPDRSDLTALHDRSRKKSIQSTHKSQRDSLGGNMVETVDIHRLNLVKINGNSTRNKQGKILESTMNSASNSDF